MSAQEISLEPEEEVSFSRFEEYFRNLDDLWEKYREEGARVIGEWDRYRVRLLDKVSKLAGIVSSLEQELEELNVKLELGLNDPERLRARMSLIDEKLSHLNTRLRSLKNFLETFERWSALHRRRMGPLPTVGGAEDIKEKLRELEELFRSEQIARDVYERIKSELETLLGLFAEA